MNTTLPSPWRFAATFLAVFFMSSVVLFAVDFVPEKPEAQVAGVAISTVVEDTVPEAPVSIVIPSIGVETPIINPTETSIAALDTALLSGAVRYPTSALLGELGTVYLFGHQSYLPVVKNQAFKAFNELQKLTAGDEILVYSATAVYTYRVSAVELVDANEALIALDITSRTLTLSTCNSFGEKSERYVVRAEFVHTSPLP